MLTMLTAALALGAPALGALANPDYTPVGELTVLHSASANTLSGKFWLEVPFNRNASNGGWGAHGLPVFYLAPATSTGHVLNFDWQVPIAALSLTPSHTSHIVSYKLTFSSPAALSSGWLMIVLKGHEWPGQAEQKQFFAAKFPLVSASGRRMVAPRPLIQRPIPVRWTPPGGSIIPITLHAKSSAAMQAPAQRKAKNWGWVGNVAGQYEFLGRNDSDEPGPTWYGFNAGDVQDGPSVIRFDLPTYRYYAAYRREPYVYDNLGGVWEAVAGFIRVGTVSSP